MYSQPEASEAPQPLGPSGQMFYSWIGANWGSCSVQCGGGTQTRSVSCVNSNGQTVSDSLCPQPRPATTQACQTEACTSYFWTQSGFSPCSVSCGGGVQTQTVSCASDKGQVVAEMFCAQPKPAVSMSCNTQACPVVPPPPPPPVNCGSAGSSMCYGFFGDARTSQADNFIVETKAMGANVHWVYSDFVAGPDPVANWRTKLNLVRSVGGKAIIDVSFVLFYNIGGDLTLHLAPDYEHRFVNVLLPVLLEYHDIIVGFYIYDEPYWHNSIFPAEKRISNAQVSHNLSVASALVKHHLYNKITMIAMAYPATGMYDIVLPSNLDWIGLDCYLEYDKKGTSNCSDERITTYYQSYLKAIMHPGQKVVVFLDAYWTGNSPEELTDHVQASLVARNNKWMEIVTGMPVAGFFTFVYNTRWQEIHPHFLFGIQNMPTVQDYIRNIYYGWVPPGALFRHNGTLYLSSGEAACSFTSGEHLVASGRQYSDYQKSTIYPEFPRLIYHGNCL